MISGCPFCLNREESLSGAITCGCGQLQVLRATGKASSGWWPKPMPLIFDRVTAPQREHALTFLVSDVGIGTGELMHAAGTVDLSGRYGPPGEVMVQGFHGWPARPGHPLAGLVVYARLWEVAGGFFLADGSSAYAREDLAPLWDKLGSPRGLKEPEYA